MEPRPQVPSAIRNFLAALFRQSGASRRIFVVGGCVRDWMLGKSTRDIDIVAEAEVLGLAQFCRRRMGGALEAFGRFKTVRLTGSRGGLRFDFARARAETYPAPAALPEVRPATLLEDLGRRDFSVNAMALRLGPAGPEELIDPHGGCRDLRAGLLRVLYPQSFRDDPTRIFRAARYAGRLGLSLERGTQLRLRDALKRGYPGLLSRERLRQELLRILAEERPGRAMRLLGRWGLWPVLHEDFRWTEAAERPLDPEVRLGLAALAMGPAGEDFIRSLHLDRSHAQALLLALKLAREKSSPRGEIPVLTRDVLKARFPGLPSSALMPIFVGGADLQRLGLRPGRAFSRLIDEAASAQWAGLFTSRDAARRWLRTIAAP